MPFATFIPGWNSLDSVRRVHSDLELIALVFFALLVLFEVLAFLEKEHTKKTLLEKIGLWFFAAAVITELIAYPYGQRNDTLSGQIIVSLDTKAEEAGGKAKKAISDANIALSLSKDALTKAGDAQSSLGKAEGEASKAQTAAASALTLAKGARSEADSFERDIVSAKEQAAKAESHLADALQRAANAEQGTSRLEERMADRTLTDKQVGEIVARLKPFAGQEFVVMAYWNIPETEAIAKRVRTALNRADWKEIPPPPGWLGSGWVGIVAIVYPGSPSSTKKAASALVLALQEQGLAAKLDEYSDPNNTDNKIHLNFLTKP